MPRAQCLVTRGDRVLMVRHRQDGQEYWCLPGGRIEAGETPNQAALRELTEECGVHGRVIRLTSVYADPSSDYAAYTYQIDIGDQQPTLGKDPELGDHQILSDMRWLTLREIPERDRVFVWSAGLLAVEGFFEEIEQWGDDPSYPGQAAASQIAGAQVSGSPPAPKPATRQAPTPYAGVNAVLGVLRSNLEAVLGENLVGIYLYGSLATGDFDLENSDIDFLAATYRDLTGEEIEALRQAHGDIAATGGQWASRLEGAYIPLSALRRHDRSNSSHPFFSMDTPFGVHELDVDWVINRHVLRERGIVICGPSPALLIDPVTRDQLAEAIHQILDGSWTKSLENPGFMQSRRYQAFAVLTMCRALYALQEGILVSKREAASWAETNLGQEWAALIRRAIRWQGDETVDVPALAETLRFVRYAIEQVGAPRTE